MSEARFATGKALRIDGCYSEAIAVLTALLTDVPDHAAARLQLGLAQVFSGDFDGGQVTMEQAVALAPTDAEARYQLAMLYAMLGRYAESVASFTALQSLGPPENPYVAEAIRQLAFFAETPPHGRDGK